MTILNNDFYNYPDNLIHSKDHNVNKQNISQTSPKCTRETASLMSRIIPTLNCADTAEWRKEIVSKAKHNVIVSGNYCGGTAFDEFLDVVEKRMQEESNLKVIIIAHPKAVSRSDNDKEVSTNAQALERIKEKFPERFSFVESPDTYYGLKKVTNHTKCTVVDYGKYFILGGSGVKDSFAQTGIENFSVEEFKQQENWTQNNNNTTRIDKAKESPSGSNGFGFIEKLIPNNFRDQDFVFEDSSENHTLGKTMYRHALMLAYKWDQFKKNEDLMGHYLPKETWNIEDLTKQSAQVIRDYPALRDTGDEEQTAKSTSALYSLMQSKLPNLNTIDTESKRFRSSTMKANDVATEVFFTGPEDSLNPFHNQMVKAVEEAKEEIVIDHMYFQPTDNLMNALIGAANRGVKITIVTAGVTENCAKAEEFFGPRNAYNYHQLITKIDKEMRHNVNVYLYQQFKKGLHKKVMIVDDKVLAGSSNMGYKSLVLMGDHEMNFIAQSKNLVNTTKKKVIDKDIELSQKVRHPETITYSEQLTAAVHSFGARIWG